MTLLLSRSDVERVLTPEVCMGEVETCSTAGETLRSTAGALRTIASWVSNTTRAGFLKAVPERDT